MKNITLLRVFVAAAAAFALVGSASAVERGMTVGAFVVKFASLRDPSAVGFDTAMKRLKADGIALPALDRDKVLTQADIVTIGNAAGLRLTTSNPATPATPSVVDSVLAFAGHQLQGIGQPGSGTQSPLGDGNDQGQNNNGQGQQKSRSRP